MHLLNMIGIETGPTDISYVILSRLQRLWNEINRNAASLVAYGYSHSVLFCVFASLLAFLFFLPADISSEPISILLAYYLISSLLLHC